MTDTPVAATIVITALLTVSTIESPRPTQTLSYFALPSFALAPLLSFFPIYLPTTTTTIVTYATTNTKWGDRDNLAYMHIILNVANIPGSELNIIGTVVEVWHSLYNRFELCDLIVM